MRLTQPVSTASKPGVIISLTQPVPAASQPALTFSVEDDSGSRAPQRLVCGGGDDIAEVKRRGRLPGSHEAGDVGHIGQEQGAHVISHAAEPGKVQVTGVA